MKDKHIEIFKRVIYEYDKFKFVIDRKIKEGYTLEMLYDLCRHVNAVSFTNVCLEHGYFDFNYYDMCLTIADYDLNGNVELTDSIEVWNDLEEEYIGTYSYDTIKKMIEEV